MLFSTETVYEDAESRYFQLRRRRFHTDLPPDVLDLAAVTELGYPSRR